MYLLRFCDFFFFADKFSSIHKPVKPEHKYNDMHL